MGSDDFEVKGATILRDSTNAILLEIDDEEHWIPFSHIIKLTRYPTSNAADVLMTRWIASKRGLL